jgi:hypothetical protein
MKTITDSWNEYRDAVIPADAHEAQVSDLRRTFYAGAWSLWGLMHTQSDEEGEKVLQHLDGVMSAERTAANIEAVGDNAAG